MESSANNSVELNDEEEEGVKTEQADSAEKTTIAEMKQLSSEVNPTARVLDVFGRGLSGALGLFPEEVWVHILDEVVDSEDIHNVFLAFPELDKSFRTKKAEWLFGLVVPHLMTSHLVLEMTQEFSDWAWTSSPELMKLRLVSKRWKIAVENALENHTDRRPFLPRENSEEGSSEGVVAIPETHFNYHRIRDCALAPTKFEQVEDFSRFLEEMRDFEGNPFPSKSVRIQGIPFVGFKSILARTIDLLERFGEHILDLEVEEYAPLVVFTPNPEGVGDLELFGNILRCLTLVPNLRALTFIGELFSHTDAEANNFYGTPESQRLFPELRNLERFEWRVRFRRESSWINRMVDTYGKKVGLRKLGIPLNLFLEVDPAFYQALHLTELHILLDSNSDQNNQRIEQVIEAVSSHREIRKFWLSSLGAPLSIQPVNILELTRMFAKFQFESVVLQNLLLVESEEQSVSQSLIPANQVTSLDLEENWRQTRHMRRLTFEFLRELPSLKFLTVYFCWTQIQELLKEYRRKKRDGIVEPEEVEGLRKILKRYFVKAYDPTLEIPENGEIWKDIPSLEMLTVVIQVKEKGRRFANLEVRFVREFGNKMFLGPRADVVDWGEERIEQVEGMEDEGEIGDDDEDDVVEDEGDDEVEDGEDDEVDDDLLDDGAEDEEDDEVEDEENGMGLGVE